MMDTDEFFTKSMGIAFGHGEFTDENTSSLPTIDAEDIPDFNISELLNIDQPKSILKDYSLCSVESGHYYLKPVKSVTSRNEHSSIPKTSNTTGSLKKQKRDFIINGENKCYECFKFFNKASELVIHMRSHTDERPYQCNQCGKAYKTTSDFNRHAKSHINNRDYICRICHQGFNGPSELKSHARKHIPIRPYHCHICDATFKHATNLRRHKLKHSGLKPYPCTLCQKTFAENYQLKIHIEKHESEIVGPYVCSICNKSLKSPQSLKRHEETHKNKLLKVKTRKKTKAAKKLKDEQNDKLFADEVLF